jgi:lipoprotein-releasing system ATP-binding protein
MVEGSAVLTVTNLRKTYNSGETSLTVLNGLDLCVEESRVVAVVGRSGSGKTTLLNLIGGLDSPSEGRVILQSTPLDSLSEEELSDYRSRHVGFIFQFHNLLSEFTALENVMMPALLLSSETGNLRKRARELLDRLSIGHKSDSKPGRLSGGESQRVAIARALINNPDIVLADEPTGNLDAATADVIRGVLFDMSRTYGHTLVIVTHNPTFVDESDVCYRLERGRLIPLLASEEE